MFHLRQATNKITLISRSIITTTTRYKQCQDKWKQSKGAKKSEICSPSKKECGEDKELLDEQSSKYQYCTPKKKCEDKEVDEKPPSKYQCTPKKKCEDREMDEKPPSKNQCTPKKQCEDKELDERPPSRNQCCKVFSKNSPGESRKCSKPKAVENPCKSSRAESSRCSKSKSAAENTCRSSCPDSSKSSKSKNTCITSRDNNMDCSKQLQEIRKALGQVACENKSTREMVECLMNKMNINKCNSSKKKSNACEVKKPKCMCGKVTTFFYIIGLAFLANLAYCIYKHGKEQQEVEEADDGQD